MWIKVDDSFVSHPKVLKGAEMLGEYGFGRLIGGWLIGQSYACKHQTDGLLPKRIAQRFDDPDVTALLTALLTCGLWEPCADGYRIHDFHDYNPKADKVKAVRKANLRRQQAYLAKRMDKQAVTAPASPPPVPVVPTSNAVNNTVNNARPVPDPDPVHLCVEDEHAVTGADVAWEQWREAWQASGRHPLALACPPKDYGHCIAFASRYPDSDWRALMLRTFFASNDPQVRKSPPSLGWFVSTWMDETDLALRSAGRRPKTEVAA